MSFIPCVEDDWRKPRHRNPDAVVLSEARRLAFISGRVEDAYALLMDSAVKSEISASLRREWQEAAMTLLSLLLGSGESRWLTSDLIQFPKKTSEARAAVKLMDNVTYHHCMLFWVKLSCQALMQREGIDVTPEQASGILLFLVKDICCRRLSAMPRCLPTWRLLEKVFNEILVLGSSNTNLSTQIATLQCMLCHLRHHILLYLEMRDRPLEGQCGLLAYRDTFDRASRGVNSGGGGGNYFDVEEFTEKNQSLSAQDLSETVQVLCGHSGVSGPRGKGREEEKEMKLGGENCRGATAAVEDIDDDFGEALESFLEKYFLQSAPSAFDRSGGSCV